MLASMTPQQFDEWVAAYRIWNPTDDEPKGDIKTALDTMRKLTGV